MQNAGGLRADDRVARPWLAWIVLGSQHHRHSRAVAPPQFAEVRKCAGGRRVEQLTERRLEQREHRLGLRITEATVEFDDGRPARGNRQPGVQQSGERVTAPNQFGSNGFDNVMDDRLVDLGRQPGQRGIGAHATGIGSGVAVPDTLEVLGRQQRHHGLAVDNAEQRHLRPVEKRLQQHRVAGLEQTRGVSAGDVAVRGDHDALARGQSVVLHHPGRIAGRQSESIQCSIQTRWTVDDLAGGGAHPGGRHHVLGEGFGPLDLRRVRWARSRRCPRRAAHRPRRAPVGPLGRSPPGQRRSGGPRPRRRQRMRRRHRAGRQATRCRHYRARWPASRPAGRCAAPTAAHVRGHRSRSPERARRVTLVWRQCAP